ncbi:MAG: hypothetical protein ABI668_10480 [Sphingorhabdus sp.]
MIRRRKYTGDDRQWERGNVTDSSLDAQQQAMLLSVIDTAHDIIEGKPEIAKFIEAARHAMIHGHSSVWQNTSNWITKIGRVAPDVKVIWNELAAHSNWQIRWRVACCLYSWGIDENQSDQLFAYLRDDKSEKVRHYAIDRYESRPNEGREVVKMFDANEFDDRVRLGEVTL